MEYDKQIRGLLYDAIGEVNEKLEPEHRSANIVLIGESQVLDSLGLVNFIVTVEQKVEQRFNKQVSLFDFIVAEDHSQLTVGIFANYIAELVEEAPPNHQTEGADVSPPI